MAKMKMMKGEEEHVRQKSIPIIQQQSIVNLNKLNVCDRLTPAVAETGNIGLAKREAHNFLAPNET